MNSQAIKVLLIDDDEDDYILTRELLSEVKVGKYKLDWASSYEEGLKVAGLGEHDVCLVDYRLGERTGVQLIREARKPRINTPMILLTGQGSDEVDVEAMQAGATDYLVKNETPASLLDRTIRYALELNTERCQAEEALSAYAQRQAVVAEIGCLALTGGDLQHLFAQAASLVASKLGVEYCEVLELLPDGESLLMRAGVGWKNEYPVGRATVGAGKEFQAGFTLFSNGPVVVEDYRTETRFGNPPLLSAHGIISGMSVVIPGRQNPYGVLGAHSSSLRRFANDDVNFLRAVANVLAEAIVRKQAEDELRKSEARFRRVIESNVFGIFFSDPGGKINTANDAFLKMVGYDRSELITGEVDWSLMSPPEYNAVDEKALAQLKSVGVCDPYEKEFIRKDGSHIPILISVATFEGAGGVAFVLDNSDRKTAEESLKQSEAWLDAIFAASRDGIVVEESNHIVYANKASATLYGRESPEEVVGKHVSHFRADNDDQRLLDFARQRIAGEDAPTMYEFTGVRQDSSFFDVEVSVSSFKSGGKSFIVSMLRDITERKQAEAERAKLVSELQSERARLADIFMHAPAFIASLRGPEHIFELANTRFYQLIGGQRDVIGVKARDAFPEVEGQAFFELLDNVYQTGVPFIGNEMPVEFADEAGVPRELKYINFVYQPLTDRNGLVSGIICHGVDVTEQVLARHSLQKSEDQLRQSQKLESVGQLAGGIAHDFNNLLTVITGYSEMSLRRLDHADPVSQHIQEIQKAAFRAASLTRQLLAFSRKQVLQPRILDLNSAILNIEKMLGRLVGEDMELCTSLAIGLGQVKADPGQIEQVILNLVVNARDAMPKGGKITIETANVYLDEACANRHVAVHPGWYALLAVTDTGHGMDLETQKHIFEPFFTTKDLSKGTGLGLSTVYGIVKQSGGNIWVYSEVGVGTSFKIYLPLVNEQITKPDAEAVRPQKIAGTETILLAEDEEMVRNLARDSLKTHGYTVLEAANGREALLICEQHEGPIHLLLTDAVMPRMSGKELADQFLTLRPDADVLYMSGYTDRAIVHHGILDENIAFIGKPFTPDALVLKVVEVIQQNQRSS
jgi:two-component system, cell cycle sensor histidine kinase and response regulator CckA